MRKNLIVAITIVWRVLHLSNAQWVGQGLTEASLAQIKTFEVEKLDLSKNEIESLRVDQFINFTKLQTLILDENKHFDFIPEQKLLISPNLLTFESKACNISKIYKETFEGLVSLMILDLSDNKLAKIENDAFATNRNLVKINLGSNSLKVLNPEVFTPTRVSHLNLYSNINLVFEKNKYLATKELTSLGLKGAGFTEITPKMLSNLPVLDELDLSENNIGSIKADAFAANKGLTELRLNDNYLKIFDPKLIADLKNLSVFCIDGNKFIRDSRNVRLQEVFVERSFRNSCFSLVDDKQRFENLDLSPLLVPKNNTEEASLAPKTNPGISDAFIGSYIALIVIIQAVALVVLIWYLIILMKPGDSKDQLDYSSTILNDSRIYAVDRRQS